MSKPYDQMTLAELWAEHERWDKEIREAKGWGAALVAADEFRRACMVRIQRREREAATT